MLLTVAISDPKYGVAADAAGALAAELPQMSESYDRYIASGLYDRNYPRPNRRTLRRLRRCLPQGGCFLDFGAGTGRYTLPLIQLTGASAVAYDISQTACEVLTRRMAEYIDSGQLTVRSDKVADMAADHADRFDLVLLGFGVLSHVPGRARRCELLALLRGTLKPGGILFLGLPNARRRFLAEQREVAPMIEAGTLEPGDILYSRGQGDGAIPMYYHLYTDDEIRRDLTETGYAVDTVAAENLLPEQLVVGNTLIGWLDDAICSVTPAHWAYDLMIESRPAAAPG